jgi:hypothetical protein
MLRYDAAAKLSYGFIALFSLLITVTPVAATSDGTVVRAQVCATSGAVVAITKPQSDSIVQQHEVQLIGIVEQTSQIEIYVDDTYNNSLSIPVGASDFSVPIDVEPGTHTIKVTANDSCQLKNGSDSIVLTYQPVTGIPPSNQSGNNGSETSSFLQTVTYRPHSISQHTDELNGLPPLPAPVLIPLHFLDIVPRTSTSTDLITVIRVLGMFIASLLIIFGWPALAKGSLRIRFMKTIAATQKHLFSFEQIAFRLVGLVVLLMILWS